MSPEALMPVRSPARWPRGAGQSGDMFARDAARGAVHSFQGELIVGPRAGFGIAAAALLVNELQGP